MLNNKLYRFFISLLLFIRFDVAVLRLDRPVHYMPHIAPICLPEKNEDFLGQYGWAAGWGAMQAGSALLVKNFSS
jgi:transmembrane protease serine 6